MKDSHLLKAAMLASVVGLILLYFMYSRAELPDSTFDQVMALEDYEEARVSGQVLDVKHFGNVTIATIFRPSTLDIVVYEDIAVPEGVEIEVVGQVSEFKGKKQLVAERVEIKD